MGGRPGRTRGGEGRGDSSYKGKIENVESLKAIKDRQLYNEMKKAISRFESVLGVRQRNVKLADLSGAYGVHLTVDGKSAGVYLNKRMYKNGTVQSIVKEKQAGYKSGWATKTNKPVAHTITHELAHATWNSHLTSPKAQAAGKEISQLYRKWLGDKANRRYVRRGYGEYARTNVNEFWAEVITKGIHGRADRYTRQAIAIAKKYKL